MVAVEISNRSWLQPTPPTDYLIGMQMMFGAGRGSASNQLSAEPESPPAHRTDEGSGARLILSEFPCGEENDNANASVNDSAWSQSSASSLDRASPGAASCQPPRPSRAGRAGNLSRGEGRHALPHAVVGYQPKADRGTRPVSS